MLGEDFVSDMSGASIGQTITNEDSILTCLSRSLQSRRLIVPELSLIAKDALPSGPWIRIQTVGQNLDSRKFIGLDKQIDDLMKPRAENRQWDAVLFAPVSERRKPGVDPYFFTQQGFGLAERKADAAHFSRDAVAQREAVLANQSADRLDHLGPSTESACQKDQCVLIGDRAIEI